jgi:hypothetical protein
MKLLNHIVSWFQVCLFFLGWGREEQKKTSFLAKGEQNKTEGMSLSRPEPK